MILEQLVVDAHLSPNIGVKQQYLAREALPRVSFRKGVKHTAMSIIFPVELQRLKPNCVPRMRPGSASTLQGWKYSKEFISLATIWHRDSQSAQKLVRPAERVSWAEMLTTAREYMVVEGKEKLGSPVSLRIPDQMNPDLLVIDQRSSLLNLGLQHRVKRWLEIYLFQTIFIGCIENRRLTEQHSYPSKNWRISRIYSSPSRSCNSGQNLSF